MDMQFDGGFNEAVVNLGEEGRFAVVDSFLYAKCPEMCAAAARIDAIGERSANQMSLDVANLLGYVFSPRGSSKKFVDVVVLLARDGEKDIEERIMGSCTAAENYTEQLASFNASAESFNAVLCGCTFVGWTVVHVRAGVHIRAA